MTDAAAARAANSIAETDELEGHLAAEAAGIILAIGLDKHPHRSVESAEEDAGSHAPLPGEDDAYSHMCPKALGRNPRQWLSSFSSPLMQSTKQRGLGQPAHYDPSRCRNKPLTHLWPPACQSTICGIR
jgi:hypothetical protein